ncbi:MAG: biotin--[acetyl-CoA-carboxylase] ligase [Bacteroidaceae bacterium]|nr:biotin--[acetyl-CoA-carboxylase] ligase [Bacteroidaceae bacterium]
MNYPYFCLDDSPFFRMIELDEVDSTNTFLRNYRPFQPVAVTLVTAEHQSAGRGQAGNHWEAEAGKNLLFSLLLHPSTLPASRAFVLSEAIALSIREAVALPQVTVTVKWPNDIYADDQKIAGILIENDLHGQHIGRSIIGCGVNVNQREWDLNKGNWRMEDGRWSVIPVSLAQLTGHEEERRFVLEHIMAGFMRRYEQIQRGNYDAIHADYLTALYRRNGLHPYHDKGGDFMAEIADVEQSGHLVLRDSEGHLHRYAFKEVSCLRSGESDEHSGQERP